RVYFADIKDQDRAIAQPDYKGLTVRREGHGRHVCVDAPKTFQLFPRGCIPQPDDLSHVCVPFVAALVPRSDKAAVRRPCDPAQRTLVSIQEADWFAGYDFPETNHRG